MTIKKSIVVTSIASSTAAMREIAVGAKQNSYDCIVVGDAKSPPKFEVEDCQFVNIQDQLESGFTLADQCPQNHYARKNIGYLIAIKQGSQFILETDDDNIPRPDFFSTGAKQQSAPILHGAGWVNVYRYFSDKKIWPRGFPLEHIADAVEPLGHFPEMEVTCPIQQGLADVDPDVDAIYRLLTPESTCFAQGRNLALGKGSWCPFNSQNTAWWPEAYPLLYLPFYCSFRMTDIWRSLIAQRVAWENGWCILFRGATVYQERNQHNLLADFQDEVPGYLNNAKIAHALSKLELSPGQEAIPENLVRCYHLLVDMGLVGKQELRLVNAWLDDMAAISF